MCAMAENMNSVTNEPNYEEAFELSGHGWYNRWALVTCSIISNAMAMDMFGFSVVVAAARCDLNLGMEETGLLASAPFAGLLFAYPWGYFADMHGRRKALLLSTSVGFLFAALSSFSTSWQVLLALKLIGYSFSTAAHTLTFTYLGECTGSHHRSQYIFIVNSINLSAEMIFYGLAYFILPLTFNVPIPWLSIAYSSWRLYVLVLSLPLGLGTLMMFFLEESPKFLANIGQTDKALESLRRIYKMNGGKKDEFPIKYLSKVEVEVEESFWGSLVKQTVPLFRPPLLFRTLQLFFVMTVCCSANNVFLMWYATTVNMFFSENHASDNIGFCQRMKNNVTVDTSYTGDSVICDNTISLNAIYSGVGLGVMLTILNLSASKFASHRKLVLIAFLLLPCISCILVGVLEQPLASLISFTLIQTSAIGIGNVASYFMDLYPTSYRGLATSLCLMVARLTSFGSVNAVGAVITDYCSLTFYFWAVVTFCGAGVCLLLPKDRKTNTIHPSNSAPTRPAG
ncbi:putative metabolite transport protein YyaJ [Epargyreus clarus]|uniref:putative metabolite transport protein YyaJ n=1 Tax=Epargyreus clarus TaxID=520877 RepID=UPI003C30A2E1